MRDAVSLLDIAVSGQKKSGCPLIEQMLGMPRSSLVFELVQHIGSGNVKGTLEQAEKMIDGGLGPMYCAISSMWIICGTC